MSKQIHAVIWDLVGVYFNDPRREIISYISRHTDKEYGVVAHTFTKSILNTDLKTGKLTFEEFIERAEEAIGYKGDILHEIDWKHAWFSRYKPRDGIEELVTEVKDKGRTNISLSDNFRELVRYLEDEHSFMRNFDACVWSYDDHVRMRKPTVKIYRETLKVAGCEGYQSVYVDDSFENCRFAEGKLGMRPVHVEPLRDDSKVIQAIRLGLKEHGIRVRKK